MELTAKEIKYLSNTVWYHGTTERYVDSLKQGIDCTFNQERELDFGAGFYLTNNSDSAKRFITRKEKYLPKNIDYLFKNSKKNEDKVVILEYHIENLVEIFEGTHYRTAIFRKYDDNFAKFVFENRLNAGVTYHPYDFIFGAQSDNLPLDLIEKYRTGLIDASTAIQELKKPTSFKQLYIQSQKFCDKMKIEDIHYLD